MRLRHGAASAYSHGHRGKYIAVQGSAQLTFFPESDLLAFHLQVYGKPFTSIGHATASDRLVSEPCAVTTTEGDEDTLSYYEDGTKRTLTDEQIAMFRHSEIQTILRMQRQRRDNQRSGDESESRSPQSENGFWEFQEAELKKDSAHLAGSIDYDDMEDEVMDDGEDDEEEYARFLETERKEMELAAAERQKKPRHDNVDDSRKTSTRRKVRELDAVAGADDVLDYGDDSPITADIANSQTPAPVKKIGKKIWWPEIAVSK